MSAARLDSSPVISRCCRVRACKRPEQGAHQHEERRDAEQDDQPERHRGVQQDDRDHHEGHQGAHRPGEHVHRVAEVGEVVGPDRDDLAGGDALGEGRAEVGGLAGDQLDDPVGGGEPVRHGVAVPHDAGQADCSSPMPKQHSGPAQQGRPVAGGDPGVDRLADDGRHEGRAGHPDHAEDHRHATVRHWPRSIHPGSATATAHRRCRDGRAEASSPGHVTNADPFEPPGSRSPTSSCSPLTPGGRGPRDVPVCAARRRRLLHGRLGA